VRFETIPAGEKRQLNGPWWGIRFIDASASAVAIVDGIVLPLASGLLLTLRAIENRPHMRYELTGPVTVQLADTYGEDLSSSAVAPAPVGGVKREVVYVTSANLMTNPVDLDFDRPIWARRASMTTQPVYGLASAQPQNVLSGTPNVRLARDVAGFVRGSPPDATRRAIYMHQANANPIVLGGIGTNFGAFAGEPPILLGQWGKEVGTGTQLSPAPQAGVVMDADMPERISARFYATVACQVSALPVWVDWLA
jgi:hypothetical protein